MPITGGPLLPAKRFDRDTLLGKQLHFLLDLTWAGRTFHLSRSTVEVTSSTGDAETFVYEGLLASEVDWEEAVSLFASSAEVQSFAFETLLPGVDVPQLVARGHDLLQATGELSLWVEGTSYEARRVLLRGRLADPEYGFADEPIRASLQAEAFEDAAIIPVLDHVITTTTWPNASEDSLGASYPVVFGAQAGTTGTTSMSPAYWVDTGILLIADHPVYGATVTISTVAASESFAVSRMADALGRVVSIVDISGAGSIPVFDDEVYMVNWDGGGAMVNREGTGPMEGAGDVLEYLLSRSSWGVDGGRMAAATPYLNRFKLAGCIVEGTRPTEYVSANLSPILPMSVVTGPFGMYVIPWRYDATAEDAVDHLNFDADPALEVDGPVTTDAAIKDVVNDFRLNWAHRLRTGAMLGASTLSGERNADDANSAESVYCRQSEARYGRRSEENESTVVYDDATAGLILAWWARAKALPSRVIRCLAGTDRAWLERGNVVTITDVRLYLAETPALVELVKTRDDGTVALTLRILDDVARTFRAA